MRILLVEDESELAKTLQGVLEPEAPRLGDGVGNGEGVQVHW